MTRKEFEKIITNYFIDEFNTYSDIVVINNNNTMTITLNNKRIIELGTLGYISTLVNTSDIIFHVNSDKSGTITIMNHSLES